MTFTGHGATPAQAALHAAQITFLGPLLGSLTRMVGGRLSDRFGGARVTFVTFCGMTVTTLALVYTSSVQAAGGGTLSGGALVLFFAAFLTLFGLTGVGNASVYKMIPSVYEARSHRLGLAEPARADWSRAHSGALIGVAGAVGGFLINMTLRTSYQSSGSATLAFVAFTAFYVVAAVITRAVYMRAAAGVDAPAAAPVSAGQWCVAAPETDAATRYRLRAAIQLFEHLPLVARAFLDGLLSARLVKQIVDRTYGVDVALLAAVDAALRGELVEPIAGGARFSARVVDAAVDEIVILLDPGGVRTVRRAARAGCGGGRPRPIATWTISSRSCTGARSVAGGRSS